MEQKQFVYGIVILVIAFMFAMGSIAIYADATDSKEYKPSKSSGSYAKPQNDNQIVINNYYQQTPVQSTPGNNCNQQVTGYYNNQPIVQCVPSGSSSSTQTTTSYPSGDVTKINIHVSSNGYYPYPSYYSRYYSYPKYYPYPQYPKYYYPYPKYPHYPQKPWW